jgi:hypothetical protein
MTSPVLRNFVALSACLLFAASACTLISHYDQVAYEHATNAKVDTLALMDKATTPYENHLKDIESVQLELAKAAEYDNGRPSNRFTIEQWKILRGDTGILNRFLESWKKSGTLSSAFINDKKEHVAREFDDIIRLESGKTKTPQGQ